jgi:hypothetical protein
VKLGGYRREKSSDCTPRFFRFAAPPTPGIRLALSQHALDVGKGLIVKALVPVLDAITIPFFYVDRDTISLNMSDIRLSGVVLGNVTAALDSSDNGVLFSIAQLSATINAKFYVRSDVWPNPSGSGTAVVTVSGASAGLVIAIGAVDEHANVSAVDAHASAGSLNIQLSGNGITWALNLLKGVITQVIENVIASKVPGVFEEVPSVLHDWSACDEGCDELENAASACIHLQCVAV